MPSKQLSKGMQIDPLGIGQTKAISGLSMVYDLRCLCRLILDHLGIFNGCNDIEKMFYAPLKTEKNPRSGNDEYPLNFSPPKVSFNVLWMEIGEGVT